MNAKDFIHYINTNKTVYFLPSFDYDEYLKGEVLGVNLVDNTILIKCKDSGISAKWFKGNYCDNRGNFIKDGVLIEIDKNSPYITSEEISSIKKYNPHYGDNRLCECGHKYYRHFDTYDDMFPVG